VGPPELLDRINKLSVTVEDRDSEIERLKLDAETALGALQSELIGEQNKHAEYVSELTKQLDNLTLQVQVLQTVVDPNAPCPACGNRQGEVKWVREVEWGNGSGRGALIHRCKVCDANWPEKPIISAKNWNFEIPEA